MRRFATTPSCAVANVRIFLTGVYVYAIRLLLVDRFPHDGFVTFRRQGVGIVCARRREEYIRIPSLLAFKLFAATDRKACFAMRHRSGARPRMRLSMRQP
ncbi:hypothetical protein HMPREF0762_01705 [Slackia exigua ATCC 700122]|uniref:Uncharacterized protein n=1 Tax=Slackia exigua (strain ATCC 700122 / DSM 15923 / CIP 105133 / JCM 11022 / KCTC 5966 / S-7) TaxID=649764 RepID=D0WIM9_SLAES|nr:hypothetical protein HMPREF0762_01705 [Slackia exigua ATCC 700122]